MPTRPTRQSSYNCCHVIDILKIFQSLDNEFPIQYAICLIEISNNEGLSLTELSKQSNIGISTISRIIGALSDHRQQGTPFGLVDVKQSKLSRRTKQIFLSAKGRRIIDQLQTLDPKAKIYA